MYDVKPLQDRTAKPVRINVKKYPTDEGGFQRYIRKMEDLFKRCFG